MFLHLAKIQVQIQERNMHRNKHHLQVKPVQNSFKQMWWWILMWKDNSGWTFSTRGRVIIFFGLVIWPEATFISFIAISVNWTLLFSCFAVVCCVCCSATWTDESISMCYCMSQGHKISLEDKITQYVIMMLTSVMLMPVHHFPICFDILSRCD